MTLPESGDASAACSRRQRWRNRTAISAWLAVIACITLVLWAGSESFSAASTSRFLRPMLLFFFPDLSPRELWRAQVWIRKAAHAVEYAALALLAFRALRLSLDTILARLAAGALLLVLVVATVDEFRQGFLSLRTGAPSDVVLDCSGALLAVGIAVAYRRRKQALQGGEKPGC
jgi:VanZ family protein